MSATVAWADEPVPARGPQVRVELLARLAPIARARDHALEAAEASWRAADERLEQAWAGLRPTVSATAARNQTRATDLTPSALSSAGPQVGYNTQLAVQMTLPLYRLQTLTTIDQAKVQLSVADLQRQVALLDLHGRLVSAVLDVLNAQEQLALTRAQKQATAEQMALARRSFTVGTVSITDVREAEAKFDAVVAQEDAAAFDLLAKREALRELVGETTHLPEPLAALAPQAAMPSLLLTDLAGWIERAEAQHPALRQARLQLGIARLEVVKADRAHAPTIDATASQTETRSSTASLFSSGNTMATQASLTLTIPLFAGGATQSRVREAVALETKARADLDAARQTVRANVRQAHYAVLAALAQVRALRTAEQSADTALRANRRGYEIGVRINADVLAAQSQLFQTRRDLVRARHEAWLQYIRLAGVAGVLAEADLALLDAQFTDVAEKS
jgi:outer membrane protein